MPNKIAGNLNVFGAPDEITEFMKIEELPPEEVGTVVAMFSRSRDIKHWVAYLSGDDITTFNNDINGGLYPDELMAIGRFYESFFERFFAKPIATK